jgi:hypothetical protein
LTAWMDQFEVWKKHGIKICKPDSIEQFISELNEGGYFH